MEIVVVSIRCEGEWVGTFITLVKADIREIREIVAFRQRKLWNKSIIINIAV